MNVGDKITMYFHCFGVTSESEQTIVSFDEKTVDISDYNNEDQPRKFYRKTGKCLNDNTFGGAHRTINPCL